MAAKKSYEGDVDLAKSFKEIIIEGPKNELEFGIVEFIGRHFSDKAIENALNSDLTIGQVLSEADKEIESSEKKPDEKLQKQTKSAVEELQEQKILQEEGREARQEATIERVLNIAERIFPRKKITDYNSISRGFGAIKNAMESESQFISTGVKDVPASEIGNLSTPNTPEVSNPSKAQGKSK